MSPIYVLLLLCSATLASSTPLASSVHCSLSRVASNSEACTVLLSLRGGIDDALDEDDEDDDSDGDEDTVAASDDALENPFLGSAGEGGSGVGLEDLRSTIQDPAALQEALKGLQDPAVQQQVKAMLEDPAFQESMKQYMEQITKDPAFQEIKKQTEAMLEDENFVEQMQKAFAEMGPGMSQAAAALAAGADGDDSENK